MKTFIAIGSLVVLALVAVLLAPFFVDWTAYRAGFEREASRLLGQPVVVRGEASARLLPFPSLTFTDVAIGETAGGEPRLTLARFGLDAELAPYLSGEIRIFQMRLEEPHLRLAIGPGGLAEWPGTGSAPAGASSVVFEDIEVTDGRVTVETGSAGRTYELSGIDAEFSASSLAGPYGGGGTLQAEGAPLRFSLSSGVVEEAGTVPFRVSVESDALDALLAFDGTAQLAGGQPDIRGAFQLASPLERPEPAPGGAPRPASPLPPVRVTAAVAASPTLAALSEMRVEVGGGEAPYVLNGEGSVDYGTGNRFSLTLSGEQVDVDTIGAEEGRPSTSATFADRVEAVRQTLAAIPPVRMPGEVKLTLPIVTAGDTTIRNVSVDGAPSPEGWDLGSFSAELPGRTLLEASGGLLVGEEDLGFRGDVLLASRQPPSFAGWLTGRVEPALNSVERAGFSAHVDLGPGTQILDDLEVDVGGETLFGRLERSGIPGERLVAVELGGDAADLDRFAAFLRLFVDGTDALEAPDRLELRFAAGPVTYAGIRAERLEADFSYDRSLLDIRRFSATGFAGTDVGIQGTVADVAGDPQPDIAVQISSPAPQRFLDFLRTRFPDTPILVGLGQAGERLGPLLLSGNAASDVAEGVPALKVRMTGSAAGTEVELALALENGLAAARESGRFGLDLALRNERPAVLLGQFGFEGIDVAVPAPLELEVALSGSETGPIVTAAAARAPGTEVYADGMLDLSEAGIEGVDLAVRLGSDDVAPWLLASGLGYASIDILPADLSAGLSWFKGDWALSDVTGSVAGSTLGAQLQATRNGSVTGAAALSELSLPWLATLVYGVPPALSDGASAENVFGVSFMPEKPFSVDLTAARLGLGEAGAIEGFVGRIDGDAQSVRLSDAAGRFAGGRLSGSAEMQNLSGFGSLRLDLAADGLVLPQPEETGLGGTLSGTVRVESGAQTYSALAASLTGEGEAVLREGHLFGVAPDLFQPILGAAEAEGFEATSAAVAALVERLGEGSAFPLGTLSTPVNVGAGVARFGPVVAERERERLSIAGALDLEEASVEAAATLSFDPGEDALEASAPSITYRFSGPLGEPRLVADVESLTGYLSARAAEREAARLEALREDLRETLRLRREARFYQARQETRERLEAERLAVEEAERQRLEREAGEAREREEAAREAERQRAEEAEAAARAAEEAEASARAEREPPPLPEPSPPPAEAQPPAGFDGPIGVGRAEPPREYEGLPGVGNPIEF